jgi:hypothetical protein
MGYDAMKYTNRIAAVRIAWIVLAMVTGGEAVARAGAVTYDINFTGTSADLPVGSFTYDAAVPAFTNFTVQWNGLLFDLSSAANSPLDDGASGPACLGGLTGAAAGFAWLNPGCQTFPFSWVANATPVGNAVLVSFDFVEQDSSTQIGFHSFDADNAINDDTTDRGAFTISPASTPAPEPATFCVLLSALALLFLVRRSQRMKTTVLLAAVSCFVYGPVARASAITYTEQATMTGFLGATTFTNALVTIVVNGDTSNITIPFAFDPGIFFNIGGVATLTIAGISGTATFTDTMMGAEVDQGLQFADIADFTSGESVLTTDNSAFATYDLSTAIGPLSGAVDGFNSEFATDKGIFRINAVSANSTFTAAATATTVPEPVSSGVAGMGLAIIAVSKLRRRRKNDTA